MTQVLVAPGGPAAGGPAPAPRRVEAYRTLPGTRLTVLVDARVADEALSRVLRALRGQTRRPAHVVVVADRGADATVRVAHAHGAKVVHPHDDADGTAGALNQALSTLAGAPRRYVMVLDAGTVVGPRFVETALERLDADPGLGAVHGVPSGPAPRGRLARCQSNEHARYARWTASTGTVGVAAGNASVFRYDALLDVARARGSALPGRAGDVYDRGALTEDSELTLALRTRGWRVTAPRGCVRSRELVPSVAELRRRRVRSYVGVLADLRAYGLTRQALSLHAQQLVHTLGALVLWVLLGVTVASAVTGTLRWRPAWLAVAGVLVLERLAAAWRAGVRARRLSLLVVPELVYDLAVRGAYLTGRRHHLTGRNPQRAHPTVGGDRTAPPHAAGAARSTASEPHSSTVCSTQETANCATRAVSRISTAWPQSGASACSATTTDSVSSITAPTVAYAAAQRPEVARASKARRTTTPMTATKSTTAATSCARATTTWGATANATASTTAGAATVARTSVLGTGSRDRAATTARAAPTTRPARTSAATWVRTSCSTARGDGAPGPAHPVRGSVGTKATTSARRPATSSRASSTSSVPV
ncbi:glycosyltransferase family 2 protein [Cellulomonas sp. Sa3CUA2]|uniref:Glycosyltransferase family 2 protein n=1 Tax=Cellulomonas avistercoris TaxID=2762242 RepID=A0ABR8Q9A9_9CELL|nr:glycosyltransferase family 2 protein [Cellulomonas avistercoris]MBD7917000.1 glycosyltransferase family 2 protein [Cellulomonas avistercoris]